MASARRLAWLAALACVVVCLGACTESSVVPPAAPSPLPAERVDALRLECPADGQARSPDGNPVALDLPAPVAVGGLAPVEITCDPPRGTPFPVGRTPVTCAARDALAQEAQCAFTVRVLPPLRLRATRMLAFGDSLTASGGGGAPPAVAWPAQLERRLRATYGAQDVRVVNEGRSGEKAAEAGGRLAAALARHRPAAVFVMHGSNDLGFGDAAVDAAVEAIDGMLRAARAAGAAPVLATVPPIRPAGREAHAEALPGFNDRLRALAAARGAALVDAHAVVADGRCAGGGRPFPCLGPDGLHPTAEGYRRIADAFYEHIARTYGAPAGGFRGAPAAPGAAAPAPRVGRGGGRPHAD